MTTYTARPAVVDALHYPTDPGIEHKAQLHRWVTERGADRCFWRQNGAYNVIDVHGTETKVLPDRWIVFDGHEFRVLTDARFQALFEPEVLP